jgi:hypothetical protein
MAKSGRVLGLGGLCLGRQMAWGLVRIGIEICVNDDVHGYEVHGMNSIAYDLFCSVADILPLSLWFTNMLQSYLCSYSSRTTYLQVVALLVLCLPLSTPVFITCRWGSCVRLTSTIDLLNHDHILCNTCKPLPDRR